MNTNFGRTYLNIVSNNFPPMHLMHKIHICHTGSVRKDQLQLHEKHWLNNFHTQKYILYSRHKIFGFSCQVKNDCSLNDKCLTPKLIYMTDFSNIENSEVKFYLGLPDIERTADNRKLSGYNAKQQNKLLITGI